MIFKIKHFLFQCKENTNDKPETSQTFLRLWPRSTVKLKLLSLSCVFICSYFFTVQVTCWWCVSVREQSSSIFSTWLKVVVTKVKCRLIFLPSVWALHKSALSFCKEIKLLDLNWFSSRSLVCCLLSVAAGIQMQEPSLSGCKYFPLIQQASLSLRADGGLFVKLLALSVVMWVVKVKVWAAAESPVQGPQKW